MLPRNAHTPLALATKLTATIRMQKENNGKGKKISRKMRILSKNGQKRREKTLTHTQHAQYIFFFIPEARRKRTQ